MSSNINRPPHHRPIRRFGLILVLAAFALAAPGRLCAQSYTVLHDGLFKVGNSWQFDSRSGTGVNYTTLWQFIRTETYGGRDTFVLRETTSAFIEDRNIVFDQNAWTVMYAYETNLLTNPALHYETKYSNFLEKIPRVVNATDNRREFGDSNSVTKMVENENYVWTRRQEMFVTFIGEQPVQVPAGTFQCIAFKIEEGWYFDSGDKAAVSRTMYMNPILGPVGMIDEMITYDEFNNETGRSSASHQLRAFTSTTPDLLIDQSSFSPNAVRTGDPFTVNWREFVLYQNAASTHTTEIWLTTDTLVTGNDFRVHSLRVPPLTVGQPVSLSQTFAMPAAPPGQYRVAIVWDTLNEVVEFSEFNATILDGTVTVDSDPDLTLILASFQPPWTTAGGMLSATGRVLNIGGEPSPATWTQVYLSNDTIIDNADLLIMAVPTPPIPAQSYFDFSATGTLPANLEGNFYIGVICDATSQAAELSETNNAFVLAPIAVGRPDLAITAGTFIPSAVHPGQTLRVQATLTNAGVTTASSNWVHLYLSPDATITPDDPLIRSGLICPVLAPGASYVLDATATVPLGLALDFYSVGLILDVVDDVPERDETNNARAIGSGPIMVTTPADLVVAQLNFSPNGVNPGDRLRVSGFVTNASGAAALDPFWIEFFISPNTDFSPPWTFLCQSAALPGLDMSQSIALTNFEVKVAPSIPAGVYTLGIYVDRLGQVLESNDANNLTVLTTKRLYIGQKPSGAGRWELYK